MGRRQRRANLQGAIRLKRKEKVFGYHVLLIDDVLTSGATANAAARALLDAGAKAVDVLVFARVGG